MFEVSPTDNIHSGGASSYVEELNSSIKSARAWNLMFPLRMYWISYSECSITQDTILPDRYVFLQDLLNMIIGFHKDLVTL